MVRFRETLSRRYVVVDKGSTLGIAWKVDSKWATADKYGNVLGTRFTTRQQAGEHLAWMMKERFGA